MLKTAYDILKDSYLAEDAVQEAFIKTACHMEQLKSLTPEKAKKYLITVTKYTAIDMYRKRKSQFELEIIRDRISNAEAFYYTNPEEPDPSYILHFLSATDRVLFYLKYYAGFCNKELSKILHMPEGAIRQKISRGKKKIRVAIEEEDKNGLQ